ncbi:hypothetical protein L195_g016252 [Trifolium pratense]|uniref:Uncharacterized protein n=2 Tax=Trifolium pratense TaxID=57577 RepID=A0A2K3MQL9_TRIPR|nr:hypothetical protein L195_g016252 [Trifolium pratense]
MAFLENKLQSVNERSFFLAIYDNQGYIEQFRALCVRYGGHTVMPCRNIETALQFDAQEINYIFIDSTLAKLDGCNFMKLAKAKYPKAHIFVTCVNVNEDEFLNMQMEANSDHHTFLRWLDVRDYDATEMEAFEDVPPGTKIFSDVFKPVRTQKRTYFMPGDGMDQIARLASFKNPKCDDSKLTGVSTELFLGLPEKDSNDNSNKRKRKQR